MKIGVPKEQHALETRVALVPAHIAGLIKAGHAIQIETNAGAAAGFPDDAYVKAGAHVTDRKTILSESEIVLAVRAGSADGDHSLKDAAIQKEGQVLIAMMDPYQAHESFKIYKEKQISSFSLELIPRITRAQSMDVLSSMASLAGYLGVLQAAENLPKMFPMMMTAAGTVVPAKVFVLGAGVAGLQALATAKRLGSVVSAFDVRPAVKEQVESLGARFVEFDLGSAEGQGGYAKELSDEQKKKQQEKLIAYAKDIDVIISTAAIPGRPSPKLISEEMVKAMAPGSVIMDLAAERGGNCVLSQPGKTIVAHGVTIMAPLNLAARLANTASQLFSKNISTFLGLFFDKEKNFSINLEDEIIAACILTHAGKGANEKNSQTLGI